MGSQEEQIINFRQKRCSCCGQEKALTEFFKNANLKDGYHNWCKSCAKQYQQSPKRKAYRMGLSQKQSVEYHMFNAAKRHSKEKNLKFDLTLEDIKVPKTCPILGIPLVRGQGNRSYNSPSLDRKIPNKGYTKDNIWVISWRANMVKKDSTVDELKLLVVNLRLHNI